MFSIQENKKAERSGTHLNEIMVEGMHETVNDVNITMMASNKWKNIKNTQNLIIFCSIL